MRILKFLELPDRLAPDPWNNLIEEKQQTLHPQQVTLGPIVCRNGFPCISFSHDNPLSTTNQDGAPLPPKNPPLKCHKMKSQAQLLFALSLRYAFLLNLDPNYTLF